MLRLLGMESFLLYKILLLMLLTRPFGHKTPLHLIPLPLIQDLPPELSLDCQHQL
jgi:hypothetical protein